MKNSEIEISFFPKYLLPVSLIGPVNLKKVGQTSFLSLHLQLYQILSHSLNFGAFSSLQFNCHSNHSINHELGVLQYISEVDVIGISKSEYEGKDEGKRYTRCKGGSKR